MQIFDLGAQDDSFFIAMEYIHGEDIRKVQKRAELYGKRIPTHADRHNLRADHGG